mmetsp:Transcript_5846/g.12658  ORF Transcript_5846/g.12658 Transcript_5846/m.12658 type:complete len:355 (+) Transcript_5846:190-1254(+)
MKPRYPVSTHMISTARKLRLFADARKFWFLGHLQGWFGCLSVLFCVHFKQRTIFHPTVYLIKIQVVIRRGWWWLITAAASSAVIGIILIRQFLKVIFQIIVCSTYHHSENIAHAFKRYLDISNVTELTSQQRNTLFIVDSVYFDIWQPRHTKLGTINILLTLSIILVQIILVTVPTSGNTDIDIIVQETVCNTRQRVGYGFHYFSIGITLTGTINICNNGSITDKFRIQKVQTRHSTNEVIALPHAFPGLGKVDKVVRIELCGIACWDRRVKVFENGILFHKLGVGWDIHKNPVLVSHTTWKSLDYYVNVGSLLPRKLCADRVRSDSSGIVLFRRVVLVQTAAVGSHLDIFVLF